MSTDYCTDIRHSSARKGDIVLMLDSGHLPYLFVLERVESARTIGRQGFALREPHRLDGLVLPNPDRLEMWTGENRLPLTADEIYVGYEAIRARLEAEERLQPYARHLTS